jgi:hypothetical protein
MKLWVWGSGIFRKNWKFYQNFIERISQKQRYDKGLNLQAKKNKFFVNL